MQTISCLVSRLLQSKQRSIGLSTPLLFKFLAHFQV
jgi:hypothetical protein